MFATCALKTHKRTGFANARTSPAFELSLVMDSQLSGKIKPSSCNLPLINGDRDLLEELIK
jgi:hypothetical protein